MNGLPACNCGKCKAPCKPQTFNVYCRVCGDLICADVPVSEYDTPAAHCNARCGDCEREANRGYMPAWAGSDWWL